MKNTKNVSSAIFVIALVFGSWAGAGAQSEITLLAVGPMRVPTQKIVANFEAKTGHKVKVTYGNGVETRRMVAKGQALDVSLIIAPFPGAISSGAIVPGSATLVASILTAVGVPKGRPKPDISTPAAVKKALLTAKSIGYEDPDFTVAGQGPLEALSRLARPADPRLINMDDAEAERLVAASVPIYYITGSIHAPETGAPTALMELAYRLAMDESPKIQGILRSFERDSELRQFECGPEAARGKRISGKR